MTRCPPGPDLGSPASSAQTAALALAEEVRRLIAVAGALASSGRNVSLAGLDGAVGLLCAKALDLPPQEAPPLRTRLLLLGADLDRLAAAIGPNPRRSPGVEAD